MCIENKKERLTVKIKNSLRIAEIKKLSAEE
jgi:hypothetical protein